MPALRPCRFLILLVAGLLLPALMLARDKNKVKLRGYLIDLVCAAERANEGPSLGLKHTKRCLQMPECDRSGFALLTDENEVLKFDEQGNEKARRLIGSRQKEKSWRIIVAGSRKEGLLTVSRLDLVE